MGAQTLTIHTCLCIYTRAESIAFHGLTKQQKQQIVTQRSTRKRGEWQRGLQKRISTHAAD